MVARNFYQLQVGCQLNKINLATNIFGCNLVANRIFFKLQTNSIFHFILATCFGCKPYGIFFLQPIVLIGIYFLQPTVFGCKKIM
jgi:hypothetical protein